MPSEAQIAANRRNAQLSTGPRTPEGKAAIRFNNLQTGIYAESETILGEDPDSLAALAASYRNQFQAVTQLESDLVDCIIHHAWLLRRLRKVEAETWEGERKRMKGITHEDFTNGEVFVHHIGAFSRMQRRIDSTERNFHRALDSFTAHRERRLAAATAAPQPPSPAPEPPAAEIGFEPSPLPAAPAAPPVPGLQPPAPGPRLSPPAANRSDPPPSDVEGFTPIPKERL